MTLPLPTSSNRSVPVERSNSGNRGLYYNKFFDLWKWEEPPNSTVGIGTVIDADGKKKEGKAAWVEKFCGKYSSNEKLAIRVKALVETAAGRTETFFTQGPLVTGTGLPHPVENGFLWHHTLGVPYLPASSVKGTVLGNLGDGVFKWIIDPNRSPGSAWWLFALCFCLFALVFGYGVRQGNKILGAIVKPVVPAKQKRRYLVMGYSPISEPDLTAINRELIELGGAAIAGTVAEYNARRALYLAEHNEAAAQAKKINSWQQNVRAAVAHKDCLKRILVLQPNADDALFQAFKAYLERALSDVGCKAPVLAIIDKDGRPWGAVERCRHYDDYRYVYTGIKRAIAMFAQYDRGQRKAPWLKRPWTRIRQFRLGGIESQICVDVTAGTKVFSIAASLLTLQDELIFSYVTTAPGDDGGMPQFYDVRLMLNSSITM